MEVVGVDACKGGWIAVTARPSSVVRCAFFSRFEQLVEANPDALVIGADIPIGLLERGARAADLAAKKLLGRAGSSVFLVPARSILSAPDYSEARRLTQRQGEPGVSAQAYALRNKIFEVEAVAASDARVYEVHPEVSFCGLAGRPVLSRKKTWEGFWERVSLLRSVGLEIPSDIGEAGRAAVDDVLDATAVAWSALRIASGEAQSLPETPERDPSGRSVAIWY